MMVSQCAAQAFSSWQFLLVDLRCHGESANIHTASQRNSVESAAADVLELLRQLKLFPEVLIGHSFGGKVVMSMADQFGRIGPRLPRPVQVSPKALPPALVPNIEGLCPGELVREKNLQSQHGTC